MSTFIYKRILKNIIIAIKINNKFHLHKLLSLYSIAICVIRCKTWWAPQMVTPGEPRRWQRSTLESMGAACLFVRHLCLFLGDSDLSLFLRHLTNNQQISSILLFSKKRLINNWTPSSYLCPVIFSFSSMFFYVFIFFKKIIYFTLCAYLFNQFFNFIWSDPVYR